MDSAHDMSAKFKADEIIPYTSQKGTMNTLESRKAISYTVECIRSSPSDKLNTLLVLEINQSYKG